MYLDLGIGRTSPLFNSRMDSLSVRLFVKLGDSCSVL